MKKIKEKNQIRNENEIIVYKLKKGIKWDDVIINMNVTEGILNKYFERKQSKLVK